MLDIYNEGGSSYQRNAPPPPEFLEDDTFVNFEDEIRDLYEAQVTSPKRKPWVRMRD